MPLFDELEALLGAEATAKLSPELKSKFTLGDQLIDFYEGKTNEQPAPRTTATATATSSTPGFDLDAIDQLLTKRLGSIDERIKTGVEEAVKVRGQELFNNATTAATNTMTSVLRVARQHRETFGEELDTDKLNEWAGDQMKKGRHFASVDEAYNAMTADRRTEKKVEETVRERLKARTSQQSVPGFTPPSAKSPSSILMMRGKSDGAGSAVSAAAAALAERRSAAQSA